MGEVLLDSDGKSQDRSVIVGLEKKREPFGIGRQKAPRGVPQGEKRK